MKIIKKNARVFFSPSLSPHADTFHVLGSTSIDESVDLVGSKGVLSPHLGEDGHDIRVTVEKQGRERGVGALEGHDHSGLALDALWFIFKEVSGGFFYAR